PTHRVEQREREREKRERERVHSVQLDFKETRPLKCEIGLRLASNGPGQNNPFYGQEHGREGEDDKVETHEAGRRCGQIGFRPPTESRRRRCGRGAAARQHGAAARSGDPGELDVAGAALVELRRAGAALA
ncbi:unnamed protein product, partial [Prorocentrum cordatum]